MYESLITEEELEYLEDLGEVYVLKPGISIPEHIKKATRSKIKIKSNMKCLRNLHSNIHRLILVK